MPTSWILLSLAMLCLLEKGSKWNHHGTLFIINISLFFHSDVNLVCDAKEKRCCYLVIWLSFVFGQLTENKSPFLHTRRWFLWPRPQSIDREPILIQGKFLNSKLGVAVTHKINCMYILERNMLRCHYLKSYSMQARLLHVLKQKSKTEAK